MTRLMFLFVLLGASLAACEKKLESDYNPRPSSQYPPVNSPPERVPTPRSTGFSVAPAQPPTMEELDRTLPPDPPPGEIPPNPAVAEESR